MRVVVVDASAVFGIDTTGMTEFLKTSEDLRSDGVDLWVAGPMLQTWAKIEVAAAEMSQEPPRMFETLDGAVLEFRQSESGKTDEA